MTGTICSVHPDGDHQYRYAGLAKELHEACESPRSFRCLCGEKFVSRCNSADASRCVPCSETYRRRVALIFQSGFEES